MFSSLKCYLRCLGHTVFLIILHLFLYCSYCVSCKYYIRVRGEKSRKHIHIIKAAKSDMIWDFFLNSFAKLLCFLKAAFLSTQALLYPILEMRLPSAMTCIRICKNTFGLPIYKLQYLAGKRSANWRSTPENKTIPVLKIHSQKNKLCDHWRKIKYRKID